MKTRIFQAIYKEAQGLGLTQDLYYKVEFEKQGQKISFPVEKIVESANKNGTEQTITGKDETNEAILLGVKTGNYFSNSLDENTKKYSKSVDTLKETNLKVDNQDKIEYFLNNIPNSKQEYSNILGSEENAKLLESKISNDKDLKEFVQVIEQIMLWKLVNTSLDGANINLYVSNNGLDFKNVEDSLGLSKGFINNLIYSYTNKINSEDVSGKEKDELIITNENQYNNPKSAFYNGEKVNLYGPFLLEASGNYEINDFKIVDNNNQEIQNTFFLDENLNEIQGNSNSEKAKKEANNKFYIGIKNSGDNGNLNVNLVGKIRKTTEKLYVPSPNKINSEQIVSKITKKETSVNIKLKQEKEQNKLDLSLREFISRHTDQNRNDIPNESLNLRVPEIDKQDLINLGKGTARFDNNQTIRKHHSKKAITVNKGDLLIITFRVYNEGTEKGAASEIASYIPDGLEVTDNDINQIWKMYDINGNETTDKTKARTVKTDKGKERILNGFAQNTMDDTGDLIRLELKVSANTEFTGKHIKITSEITKEQNEDGNEVTEDRDSTCNNLAEKSDGYNPGTSEDGKGYEDDDDYEDIVLEGKYFDLALREVISKVEDQDGNVKFDGVSNGRVPVVDTSKLKTKEDTTAIYKHSKSPISVSIGDIVTYTIYVYNEGEVDGWAKEITMHLPQELDFIADNVGDNGKWLIDKNDKSLRTIKTNGLDGSQETGNEENVIKAFDVNQDISYKTITIKLRVNKNAQNKKYITNICEISGDTTQNNNLGLADRDNVKNANLPTNDDYSNYTRK